MTPKELLSKLQDFFSTTDMADGTYLYKDGTRIKPHTINCGEGESCGEIADDAQSILQHLLQNPFETGTYSAMRWFDIVDAAVFAGLIPADADEDDEYETVSRICVEDGDPADPSDYFEHHFGIHGFLQFNSDIDMESVNDCSEFRLVLKPCVA